MEPVAEGQGRVRLIRRPGERYASSIAQSSLKPQDVVVGTIGPSLHVVFDGFHARGPIVHAQGRFVHAQRPVIHIGRRGSPRRRVGLSTGFRQAGSRTGVRLWGIGMPRHAGQTARCRRGPSLGASAVSWVAQSDRRHARRSRAWSGSARDRPGHFAERRCGATSGGIAPTRAASAEAGRQCGSSTASEAAANGQ